MTSQTREQRRGWLAGLLAAALFGSSAPLIGSFSRGPSPVLVAGLLYTGAALVLLPLAVAEAPRSRHAPIQRQDLPLLGLITLLGGIAGPIALVKGLALLTPGASALLLNLEAVFTVLIAVGVGKEHLGRDGWTAAALTLTGALVLSAGPLGGSQWQGVQWIALACLCWGIDNNLSQRLSLRNPLQISAAKALGAALPMLAVAHLQGHAIPFVWMSAALLGIGSLGYGVSIWLDMVALASLGAARKPWSSPPLPSSAPWWRWPCWVHRSVHRLCWRRPPWRSAQACCCDPAMATGTAMPNSITSTATSMPLSVAIRTTFIRTDRRISRPSSLASPSGTAIATAMTRWPTSTPTSATCTTAISTEPSALPTHQIRITWSALS